MRSQTVVIAFVAMKRTALLLTLLAGCSGARSGGSLQATLTELQGTNANNTAFAAVRVDGEIGDKDGVFVFSGDDHPASAPGVTSPGRLVTINIKDSNGGTTPIAGRQYSLQAPDVNDKGWFKPGVAALTITERLADSSYRSWSATQGSVTVEMAEGGRVSLTFAGTMMRGAQFTSSLGTFTLQGECVIDQVSHVQHFRGD